MDLGPSRVKQNLGSTDLGLSELGRSGLRRPNNWESVTGSRQRSLADLSAMSAQTAFKVRLYDKRARFRTLLTGFPFSKMRVSAESIELAGPKNRVYAVFRKHDLDRIVLRRRFWYPFFHFLDPDGIELSHYVSCTVDASKLMVKQLDLCGWKVDVSKA